MMQDLDCAPSVTNYVTWAVKFSGSLSLVLCVIGISRLAIPLVGQGGMGPGREKSVVGHSGMGPLHGENFVDRMAQGFGMERAWWPGWHGLLAWKEHGGYSDTGPLAQSETWPGRLLYKTKSASAVAIDGVFLDQPLSSVSAGLGRNVPASHLVAHRDTDPESVGTVACRPEGGGKTCVLTGPIASVILPKPTGDPPPCLQAAERNSSHLPFLTPLGGGGSACCPAGLGLFGFKMRQLLVPQEPLDSLWDPSWCERHNEWCRAWSPGRI